MEKFRDVLLAEDDEFDYQFFADAFNKVSSASKVSRVSSGIECMQHLRSGNIPDIIFLDLKMPGRNGLDCLKLIKENSLLANIPVIIFSMSHYIKDIDAAYKNGAHYYIVKPADEKGMQELLYKVLRNLSESAIRPAKDRFVVRTLVSVISLEAA